MMLIRMTEIGHECHRDDYTVCVSSILVSEHHTVFDCPCDARACAILHSDESFMMLHSSEMRGASNDGSELSGD